jgi:adenylate cyclase
MSGGDCMTVSSRTPEGDANRCPICGNTLRLEPSRPPGDAPCPSCGSLLWFPALTTAYGKPNEEAPPAADFNPNGELIVVSGGDSIPLTRPHLTLGRRDSCDICLPFPTVSGIHCELDFTDGCWAIRDRNSTNGVRVNGVRVAETVLQPGDTITIARRDFTIKYTPSVGIQPLG